MIAARRREGVLAVLLTAIAIGIPAIAWYLAGARDAERAQARLREEALATARAEAESLAGRLSARIERLADAESRRPFYHYRNLFHDPAGASSGAAVAPSPLAAPPADPLVHAYFQVDARGRVTLPRLNDALPELDPSPDARALCSLKDALAAIAAPINASVSPECPTGSQELLPAAAWRQIAHADELFANLRGRAAAAPPPAEQGSVTTCVGPLSWRTFALGGSESLFALRHVETPDGGLTQGFMLDHAELDALLPPTARLVAGETYDEATSARLLLAGAPWHVAVDATSLLLAADARAAAQRAAFTRTFALGLTLALLAGAGVILVAWQARRLARRRELFAAAAAHELRTPLASIQLHGGMLAAGLGDPARAPAHARRVAEEAARLSRVVTNLLTVTLGERGGMPVAPVACDLADAVTTLVERQRARLEGAGARVVVNAEDGLPEALADGDALAQILQNLLDNALRHAGEADDRGIVVSVARSGPGFVAVRVEDRGPGVPAAWRERIFEPFARVNPAASSGGLGLGLSLSRALARACGGDLACEERDGGGASFVLTLPIADVHDVRERGLA